MQYVNIFSSKIQPISQVQYHFSSLANIKFWEICQPSKRVSGIDFAQYFFQENSISETIIINQTAFLKSRDGFGIIVSYNILSLFEIDSLNISFSPSKKYFSIYLSWNAKKKIFEEKNHHQEGVVLWVTIFQ